MPDVDGRPSSTDRDRRARLRKVDAQQLAEANAFSGAEPHGLALPLSTDPKGVLSSCLLLFLVGVYALIEPLLATIGYPLLADKLGHLLLEIVTGHNRR